MIIGKICVFQRQEVKHGAIPVQKKYQGRVLDKFRARDKSEVDRKIYIIDFYLVQLPNGRVRPFACDELIEVLEYIEFTEEAVAQEITS